MWGGRGYCEGGNESEIFFWIEMECHNKEIFPILADGWNKKIWSYVLPWEFYEA